MVRIVLTAVWIIALLVGCGSDDDASGPPPAPPTVAWTVAPDSVGNALMVTPATALRGASVYGMIVTRELTDADGSGFAPSADFAAQLGTAPAGASESTVHYSDEVEAAENPYPDARLVREDGTIRVPDRYVLRGMPDTSEAADGIALLRTGADRLETLRGYTTTGPIRISLSAPADLATADADSILLFRRDDGRDDLEGLLELAHALDIERDDIALAISFPTQPIEDDLRTVQAFLRGRVSAGANFITLEDSDPNDDLPIGVFAEGDGVYEDTFASSPDVIEIVSGLVASPDFRDEDGIWSPQFLAGEADPPEAELHFLLTVPRNAAAPYPVVLVQHGFGGSNDTVLDLSQMLAERGLAAIGINAVSHGRRGSAFDLLRARPFVAREIFRQTIADQMAVLRAVEAGIDIDGDGRADLDSNDMSFIGISLGGLLGASLVAVEDILPTAVLNVAGGRVAFLGHTIGLRDLVQGALSEEIGLTQDHPTFQIYLSRVLESGQHAMDPVDGLNYARHWFMEPFSERPHRVLLQEGIGDELVDNESTEALAEAAGMIANTPMSDSAGVSGLWRFDPPGGHGILNREDVRRQAAVFLASGGTELIDP